MAVNITNFGFINYKDNHREYNIHTTGNNIADIIRQCEAEDIQAEEVIESKQRGRRVKELFAEQETAQKETQRLLNYLRAHNLSSNILDSSADNSCNQIAVCFFRQWHKRNLLQPNAGGIALARYLKSDCELQIGVEEKALGNVLSRMINSTQSYPNWSGEISAYFQN